MRDGMGQFKRATTISNKVYGTYGFGIRHCAIIITHISEREREKHNARVRVGVFAAAEETLTKRIYVKNKFNNSHKI